MWINCGNAGQVDRSDEMGLAACLQQGDGSYTGGPPVEAAHFVFCESRTTSCLSRKKDTASRRTSFMKKATFPTMAGNPPADGAQPSGIPPPPIRYEVAPPPPSEVGYVWTQGYWAPYEGHYVWCPGRWVRQPYEEASWRGVQWEHGDHAWRYHEGYWDHHELR